MHGMPGTQPSIGEQERFMAEQQHTGDCFKKSRIGVLLGGLSPESDVSRRSGAAMCAALQRLGYTVTAH